MPSSGRARRCPKSCCSTRTAPRVPKPLSVGSSRPSCVPSVSGSARYCLRATGISLRGWGRNERRPYRLARLNICVPVRQVYALIIPCVLSSVRLQTEACVREGSPRAGTTLSQKSIEVEEKAYYPGNPSNRNIRYGTLVYRTPSLQKTGMHKPRLKQIRNPDTHTQQQT